MAGRSSGAGGGRGLLCSVVLAAAGNAFTLIEGQPARLFRFRNKIAFILAGALPSSTLLPEDRDGPARQTHGPSFYGSTFWKTTASQAAAILVGWGKKSLPEGEKGEP